MMKSLVFSISQIIAMVMASNNNPSFEHAVMKTKATRNQKKMQQKLLQNARKLEQDAGGGDDAMEYLSDYSLKVIKCIDDAAIEDDNNNGQLQYGAVVFRLCPSKNCHDTQGCSKDFADYAVGLNTFVEAFFEDQQDNMENWDDDNFDADEFSTCNQYNPENGNDGVNYYIGPTCTEDGLDIRLALFEDQYCSWTSNSTFESVSNGWSLPYGDGGLVSTDCTDCAEDGGNNDYGLREMCTDLYQAAPYRCETEWSVQHYYYDYITEIYRYGQATMGCTYINGWEGKRNRMGTDWFGIFFVTFLLLVSVGGGVWYTIWWKQKKATLEKIQDDDSNVSGEWHQIEDDGSGVAGSQAGSKKEGSLV